VAKRLGDGFLALLGYDNHRRLLAPSLDERRGVLGRGGLERVVGEDPERAFVCVGRERGAKRRFPLLAVDLAPEARAYGEGDAAAGPVRGAGRAGARPPGALLAPRLRASARDEPAALDGARAGAVRAQFGAHGLVDEVRLDVGAEDARIERQVLRLVARTVEHGSLRRCHGVPPRAPLRSRSSGPGRLP